MRRVSEEGDVCRSTAVRHAVHTHAAITGTLGTLQLMLKNVDAVSNATLAFHFSDNCLADWRQAAALRSWDSGHAANASVAWQDWVGGSHERPVGPYSIMPPLKYQNSGWRPSSLDCHALPFPSYDWVWPSVSASAHGSGGAGPLVDDVLLRLPDPAPQPCLPAARECFLAACAEQMAPTACACGVSAYRFDGNSRLLACLAAGHHRGQSQPC